MEIILNRVSYIYDEGMSYETNALIGVDLRVGPGEFIGCIGRTGSGKSTLVKLFNGLIKPTYGGVYVDGQDINDGDYPIASLRGRVGMVFQYPEQQLFESSVIKDVMFGPTNQGLDTMTVELRSFEALKKVGISEDLLDVGPLQLSGGQKRRVAIAGVLAMQPEILIMDEPTAGLDPGGQRDIFELLHSLHEQGITIVMISHNMEDVANHTDRVWVMSEGRIVIDDKPDVVFSRPDVLEELGLKSTVASYVSSSLKGRGLMPDGTVTTDKQLINLFFPGAI
ncbi:MAG TPA: energy-coupling factor transporter ATPase [Lachnospiraceae bacterium]|nr:energy-coupling factor transporter ATPase [Lachnospiraceae bacterium]